MLLDVILQPLFPANDYFRNSLVIMVDLLRASTTVCSALFHGAKEVIPIGNVEEAVALYGNLSKEVRFIGGERNGVKLSGFNAGNSPLEYTENAVKGKSVIITTTNGTQLFSQCREASGKFVGGFANFTKLTQYVSEKAKSDASIGKIVIACAGEEKMFDYEDAVCAGAYIKRIAELIENTQLTDSAKAASSLFSIQESRLKEFLSETSHGILLKGLGYSEDVEIAGDYDIYPVVPGIFNKSIKAL